MTALVTDLLDPPARPSRHDRSAERETLFWSDADPETTKFTIEKLTGTLLRRDANAHRLIYRGLSPGAPVSREIELRLEAVIDGRLLYALHATLASPRGWMSDATFARTVDRAYTHWCARLALPTSQIAWSRASTERYDAVVLAAIEQAGESPGSVDDPWTIAVLQETVLAALRDGMCFFATGKEGTIRFHFDGLSFMRTDRGDRRADLRFEAPAFLAALRAFYDWPSWSATHPHPPPEREVWRFIAAQRVSR